MSREEARRREAAELDGEILEAIGRGWDDPLDEVRFDRLARDVFAHQFRFNPVYRQVCLLRGVSAPADVAAWRDIPPVPAGAFKVGRWAAFPPEAERAAFRTSGTTWDAPGVHHVETLALYNAAAVSSARRFLVPDLERVRWLFLSPPPREAPHSSLVHMFAVFREALGEPGSGFFLAAGPGGGVRAAELAAALDRAVAEGAPVLVAGASLALAGALSALEDRRWALPDGSRAMLTGGSKGRRADVDPLALEREIVDRLGVPAERQAAEYGMTELSSQYYDERLRASVVGGEPAPGGTFAEPPWTRVRVVDPVDGSDVRAGGTGALVHLDLANRSSALVVQTSDVGTRAGPRTFRLTGRAPDAEARGCSLAAELWLGDG